MNYPRIIFVLNQTVCLMNLNFQGIVIGVATFLVIGLFHPLVIKAEYYIGVKSWWLFLILGVLSVIASLLVANIIVSILLGVVAFSSFWSIGEVFQQNNRVEEGVANGNLKKRSGITLLNHPWQCFLPFVCSQDVSQESREQRQKPHCSPRLLASWAVI